MRTLILVTLSAVLALSACSSEDPPGPLELPDEPPGAQLLDDAALATQLDTLEEGLREVTGASVGWEVVYDVTDGGAEELIDYYDEALTSAGWEVATNAPDITNSLGASWWRDGRSVVLLTVGIEGRDLAILIPPAPDES